MVRRRWVGKCLDLQSLPWLVNDQLINIVQSFSLFTLTCHRKEAENTAAGDNKQRKVGKKTAGLREVSEIMLKYTIEFNL